MAADRIAALIEYFKAWPGWGSVPVFAPRIPAKQAPFMPTECVVLSQMGGFGDLEGMGLYHLRVGVMAYGATAQSASALHDKCMAALNALDDYYSHEAMLCTAELESGALDDYELGNGNDNNRLNWSYTESTWGIMTIFD